jgi:hypothetical protein
MWIKIEDEYRCVIHAAIVHVRFNELIPRSVLENLPASAFSKFKFKDEDEELLRKLILEKYDVPIDFVMKVVYYNINVNGFDVLIEHPSFEVHEDGNQVIRLTRKANN